MNFYILLAQNAETLSFLQAVLNGGVPLLLLVALCIVGWVYWKEKGARAEADKQYMEDNAKLREQFTDKIESLFRERLESETENARVIMRATEALESVNNTLDRTNETLDSLTEE